MINKFWIFKIYSYLGKPLPRTKGDELIGNIKELIYIAY